MSLETLIYHLPNEFETWMDNKHKVIGEYFKFYHFEGMCGAELFVDYCTITDDLERVAILSAYLNDVDVLENAINKGAHNFLRYAQESAKKNHLVTILKLKKKADEMGKYWDWFSIGMIAAKMGSPSVLLHVFMYEIQSQEEFDAIYRSAYKNKNNLLDLIVPILRSNKLIR